VKPEELSYTKTHEWVHVEKDPSGARIATLGISAFAVEALTDLVYIDLPEAGREVKAGEPFAEIESVKAVSDIYSPVNGEVVEVNGQLSDNLEKISDDPYGAGWLAKIRLSDGGQPSGLLDYAAYQKLCEEEKER
jgi:glycine cleavage system H protein